MKSYVKTVEKAAPSFSDTAEKQHSRNASDPEPILADVGVAADRDATLMGTKNQAVITFRAPFNDIDETVKDQARLSFPSTHLLKHWRLI